MNSTWTGVIFVVSGVCLLAAAMLTVRHVRIVRRLEKLLDIYEKAADGDVTHAELDRMEETRESKLENRLYHILSRTEAFREKTSRERDQVASLLSDLSHQLKMPLANMVMYSELLEEETLDYGQRRGFVRETRAQAEKMQWLLKSMLKASQLEQGIIAFAAEYTGIKKTIAMAVGGIYARASDRKISIVTEEAPDRRLYHNRRWTAEALDNILDNAVKYSPEGSKIRIRLYSMDIYTRLEIEDEGAGMDSAEYNEIFKRFYRGKQAQNQEGNGLGLYLAQLILNKEKGYITVTSQPGKGSCFYVYLLNENTPRDIPC